MTKREESHWITAENARQYDEYTKTSFARIYPVVAGQILQRTEITTGTCLDVGSGSAPLALAIAALSTLRVITIDSSPEMYARAVQNIQTQNMSDQVIPILGDVSAIPFRNCAFNLVISRGSYHFWGDLSAVLQEIVRVISPGGMAYIGGGYGSSAIRDEILVIRKNREIVDSLDSPIRPRFQKFKLNEIELSISKAGICSYQLINDDSGFWILVSKSK